jgi:hypothetical protein
MSYLSIKTIESVLIEYIYMANASGLVEREKIKPRVIITRRREETFQLN